ncbi:Asparaginase/glutaminase [Tribonema minus]|uniref:asparaginase n=1 Tax=Tribonema minus TaxID=303371 RepID=A0A835Z9K3_9STRA|nr:Asparaginase/glutaminase [Tribonema minus]
MQKDDTGSLAPKPGFFTERIFMLEELVRAEMPTFDVVEYSPLLDSSCFTPDDWKNVATDIGAAYDRYKGFVVCMGTDTMAYAASALSFMLENLGKPVVFTGSQIPFVEAYNDARRNVCLFFSDRLLRGNRACKMHATGLQAFESPNFPPLATLDVHVQYRRELALPRPAAPLRLHTHMDSHIIALKLIPGFDDEALLSLVSHSMTLKAIVLLAYGTGNSPNRREGFLQFVRLARQRCILIVAITQCPQGGVSLDTYAVGKHLKGLGVVSGGDMTTEAAVTKLAFLFSAHSDVDSVAAAMAADLRGELSARPALSHVELVSRARGRGGGLMTRAAAASIASKL